MKKALKWIAAIVLTPILLFIILTLLLYFPPIQNWAVKQAARYASEKTGKEISIEHVRLSFPIDIELDGFLMIQPHEFSLHQKDTIADVRRLTVSVQALPLFHKRVEIDAMELMSAKVNTAQLIPDTRIRGHVGRLYLESHGVDLSESLAKIDKAILENSKLDIALGDTVPADTAKKPTPWKIALEDFSVSKTDFSLHMPGDTMSIRAIFENAKAKQTELLLHDNIYKLKSFDWHGGSFHYDMNYVRQSHGFDASHMAFSSVNIGVDSFIYRKPEISMRLRAGNFKEKSGLNVDALSGHFRMDSLHIQMPDLSIQMPGSDIDANFSMEKNAFANFNPGEMHLNAVGHVSKSDVAPFLTSLPSHYLAEIPDKPLYVHGTIYGNLKHMSMRHLRMNMPGFFNIATNGWLANLQNIDHLKADVDVKGKTGNMRFVKLFVPKSSRSSFNIPNNIDLDGNIKVAHGLYSTNMRIAQGGGNAHVKGYFDTRTDAYKVHVSAQRFPLHHFIPHKDLHAFSGSVMMSGSGLDFLSPHSSVSVTANLGKFSYGKWNLSGIGGNISLRHGLLDARIRSRNPMFAGNFRVAGRLDTHAMNIHFIGNVSRADLRRIGIVDRNYVVSTYADLWIKSDMKAKHSAYGILDHFQFGERRKNQGLIPLLAGSFNVDGTMNGKMLHAHLNGDLAHADLYQLGLVDAASSLSTKANIDIRSDFNDYYYVNGQVGNLRIVDKGKVYVPGDMSLDILSTRDTTHAMIAGGDFHFDLDAGDGYQKLLKGGQQFASILQKQFKDRRIDQLVLRKKLPSGHLYLKSGANNVISHLIAQKGFSFRGVEADLTSSNREGVNGHVLIDSLVDVADSLVFNTAELTLNHTDNRLNYNFAVRNHADNSYPFKGFLDGYLSETGLMANTKILDRDDKTGLDMSVQAALERHGIRLSVSSPKSIIGYKSFEVNDSNYVFIGDDRRVSADMKLLADDGAGVQIFTDDADSLSLQNVTLSMHKFELGKLFTILPFAPKVSGVLNGDYHVIQTANDLTVSSDMNIRNLIYEGNQMGNVGTQLVYMPQTDGSHYVDAIITKEGTEVGVLSGTYKSDGDGYLDATFNMDKFPLSYVNGFVPDQIIGLRGNGDGNLQVQGPLSKLDINGEIYLDSSYLYSLPYGVEMRFADDPVIIKNSRLLFENFEMFANNDSPLNVSGYLDFSSFDNMYLDTRMRAQNFQLIDSKENPRSTVYGKAFVNFFGAVRGPVNRLRMGGRLEVLGNTDMTYVMRESGLSTDNQLDELVQFTNLHDTIAEVITRPDIQGFQMDMSVNIDEQAHIVCALNADHTNYIDLIGGGDLLMHYDPTNDMTLRGRYTLNSGQMKYSIDMIPLRTFNIQDGSYIEFTGNPMNPILNITAKENIRANFSGSTDRLVDFKAGVHITKTLDKPGVEFIVDAPEDIEVQNTLNTKSVEERGKIAVTLLASGMYLGDGNSGFAMNGALASFMQSTINNVTGRALSSMGLDITANMESAADATGSLHTDYTFNFSKRLLNNRLHIIMGGRVSTGGNVAESNGAYFDNFSLEYRLNKNETQYLKLYYEREAYDWLEGQLSEFGAGFMWRRKLQTFRDIFRFKSQKEEIPRAPLRKDSLVTFTNDKK